ncbi:MAG: hypothetical protein OCC49_18180, partial [Fibrobacterales bacterium]
MGPVKEVGAFNRGLRVVTTWPSSASISAVSESAVACAPTLTSSKGSRLVAAIQSTYSSSAMVLATLSG